MARGSSILSAILGGVGGGVEAGLAQRERERVAREREAEQERLARAERLQFLNAGFEDADQAGARDMPGATPRKPFATETMAGGQRVVMREAPEVRKHRADVLETKGEIAKATAIEGARQARQTEAVGRSNRGYFNILQKAGELPPEMKFEDVQDSFGDLKPMFDEYMARRREDAAMGRAQVMASAQRGRVGTFQTGIGPSGEEEIFGFTGAGEPVATGVKKPVTKEGTTLSRNILTNSQPLTRQELETLREYQPIPIKDAKGNITGFRPPKRQLGKAQAAISATYGGTPGAKGMAASFMQGEEARRVYPLLNIVADRRAAIEEGGRLTEGDIARRRQSILPLGPDVDDPEALYRKIERAIRWATDDPGEEAPTQARPTPSAAPRPSAQPPATSQSPMSPAAWMNANPQRPGETDEQYIARGRAATGG